MMSYTRNQEARHQRLSCSAHLSQVRNGLDFTNLVIAERGAKIVDGDVQDNAPARGAHNTVDLLCPSGSSFIRPDM